MLKRVKTILHEIFLAGIFIKLIDGILQLIGGTILLIVKSNIITKFIQRLYEHELFEDPKDWIANYIVQATHSITFSMMIFIGIYLVIHGIINIGLFLGLWHHQTWAYPLATIILSIFVVYQTVRIIRSHSLILLLITLVDVSLIVLMQFEYKNAKRAHKHGSK